MTQHLSQHSVPKRKLRDALAGTLSSFISRNHDMWGYWGIGVLCLEALKAETSSVEIDILRQTASFPQAHDPHHAEVMHTRLIRRLTAMNVPVELVSQLSISVQFIPVENHQAEITETTETTGADPIHRRYQARCVGTLVDHFGHQYQRERVVRCLPHHPERELRSSRFYEYRRFLIIGSTGHIGQAVVRSLRDDGLHTIAHINPDSPQCEEMTAMFSSLGAVVDTAPWSDVALSDMLLQHKPTHILSLLGPSRSKAKSATHRGEDRGENRGEDRGEDRGDVPTDQDVDRDLSLLLLRSIEEANAQRSTPQVQPKYIFLSLMGVTQRVKTPDPRARGDVERHIQASALPWVIARPSSIPGFVSGSLSDADHSEYRSVERLRVAVCDALLGSMKILGIKKPYQRYGSLSADQLAQGLVRCALDDSVVNQTLNTSQIRRWVSS